MKLSKCREMVVLGGQLPSDENLKPFYALGVNIARQVGGDIKPLLSAAEIGVFMNGFQVINTIKKCHPFIY